MNRTRNLSPVAARERWSPGRRLRLRVGVGMMSVAALASIFVAPFGIARAAEDAASAKPLEVTKQAYWTRSMGHAAPPSVTNNFPASVVCLVWPDSAPVHICGGPLDHGQGVDSIVQQAQPKDHVPGSEPLGEFMAGGTDTLPTGVLAGARRYLSAIEFEVPDVAADERVSKFELRLTQIDEDRLNYHFDSPAFRQAVAAAIVAVGRDPEKLQDEARKIPDREPLVETPLGIEACPILVDWEKGGNQDGKAAPERDAVERTADGKVLEPQVNCVLGANGKLADGVWTFDLTLAANAWAEGRIDNKGVLLRPVLPPNLAHGDPDLSTWDQVTLHSPLTTEVAAELPAFVMETKEKTKPLLLGGARTESQVLGAQTETFTEVFGALEQASSPNGGGSTTSDAPVVEQAAPALLSGDPVTQWWVWMLLPLFLGGIYLTTQALTTEAALVGAEERAGAMTRLIEARRRGELT